MNNRYDDYSYQRPDMAYGRPRRPMDTGCKDDGGVDAGRNRGNMPGDKDCKKGDKNKLMKQIYEYGLVMTEAALFLDTHPANKDALAYFQDVKDKYNDLVASYSAYYGPLNLSNVASDNYWTWVATPMPWEVEGR